MGLEIADLEEIRDAALVKVKSGLGSVVTSWSFGGNSVTKSATEGLSPTTMLQEALYAIRVYDGKSHQTMYARFL